MGAWLFDHHQSMASGTVRVFSRLEICRNRVHTSADSGLSVGDPNFIELQYKLSQHSLSVLLQAGYSFVKEETGYLQMRVLLSGAFHVN
jgi:hypothetical protein